LRRSRVILPSGTIWGHEQFLSEFGAHIRSAAEEVLRWPNFYGRHFHAPVQAREAIEALKANGFEPDEISVLSPDPRPTHSDQDAGTRAERLTADSALAGMVMGRS